MVSSRLSRRKKYTRCSRVVSCYAVLRGLLLRPGGALPQGWLVGRLSKKRGPSPRPERGQVLLQLNRDRRASPVYLRQKWKPCRIMRYLQCVYGHTYSKSMDQPGKVGCQSWSCQLNMENEHFPVPVRAWELVWRDGFGSPVPRQPSHFPHSSWIWCLLSGFPRFPRRRPSICLNRHSPLG